MLRSQDQKTADGDDAHDTGTTQTALSNPLILRQIFINFPTTELISCLSRVNRNWNFQARTFVRNFRNDCQANFPNLSSVSSPSTCVPCVRLREFSDTVNSMTVVPFTSISIVKHYGNTEDSQKECQNYSESSATNIEKIVRRLNLKKLSIQLDPWDRISCAATQYFVFLLLREHSSQLETLGIRRAVPSLLHNLLQSWTGELVQLERIEWETSCQELERNRTFLEKLFESKTLKFLRLGPACLFEALEMFPADKYCRMLDRFDLEIRNEFKRRDQCLRVGRSGPALSELHIFDCHPDFKPDLLTVLGQLLRSSQLSLKAVRIRQLEMDFRELFTLIEWPTLENVKNFQLETRGSYREWATILREFIDYGRIFPALETVSLDHMCGGDDEQEYEAEHEWAPDPASVRHFSPSVTKLELSLELGQVSLPQLREIFPSVRFLKLENLSPNNLPALDQVFSLWPHLDQLILTGDNNAEENDYWQNFDAELCGISREEVETLWGKDEEFLRALQIVPIRPCITTMPKLRTLRLLLWAPDETAEPQSKWCEPSRRFLTHVAKLLAFDKLPELEFLEIIGPRLPRSRFDPGDIRCHPWQRWET